MVTLDAYAVPQSTIHHYFRKTLAMRALSLTGGKSARQNSKKIAELRHMQPRRHRNGVGRHFRPLVERGTIMEQPGSQNNPKSLNDPEWQSQQDDTCHHH